MDNAMPVVKPLINEELKVNGHDSYIGEKFQTFNGISWPSSSWQDGSHRSAFQPYRPTTVLTNLQRGNIQTNTPQADPIEVTWFEKAGRGDLAAQDIKDVSDINIVDEEGLNALMWSAAYGQSSAVQLLIEAGADVHRKGFNDQSALHLAAAGGHHDVIRLLLTKGADVNDTDDEGNTPLIYAVFGDHPHSVHELLSRGADITISNLYGQKPFNLALHATNIQVQLVLELHLISLLSLVKQE